MMKVIIGFPPNFWKLRKAFPYIIGRKDILYAYGDRIYNPSGNPVPHPLMVHESVHGLEQDACGVEQWWERYIAEPEFRFGQEALAHIAEYRAFCDEHKGIVLRDQYLDFISHRLASQLYGCMVRPTEARAVILGIVPERSDAPVAG